MSLREDLKALGLPEEQLSPIEAVVKKFVAGEFIPKIRFDEVTTKAKELSQELVRAESEKTTAEKRAKEAEDKLVPLTESLEATKKEWEKKYADLEEAHRQEEEGRALMEAYENKINIIKDFIKDSAYDVDMVSSLIDLDQIDPDGDPKADAQKLVEQLKKDKAFLFKDSETIQSTAPHSDPTPGSTSQKLDFGQQLAKRAAESDALTKAAEDKYFN